MSHFCDRIWNFASHPGAIRSTRSGAAVRRVALVRSASVLLGVLRRRPVELPTDRRCSCS